MNHDPDDTQLENLLRGLAPAAASPALAQRVDEELKLDMSWLGTSTVRRKPQALPRWLMSTGWAAMGAAAAIAVMSYLPTQRTQGGAAALATAPVVLPGATTLREWDDSKDRGIHQGRSSLAEKHALVVSRELGTWVDSRYDAQMSMEIPSKQQLLMPVSFQ